MSFHLEFDFACVIYCIVLSFCLFHIQVEDFWLVHLKDSLLYPSEDFFQWISICCDFVMSWRCVYALMLRIWLLMFATVKDSNIICLSRWFSCSLSSLCRQWWWWYNVRTSDSRQSWWRVWVRVRWPTHISSRWWRPSIDSPSTTERLLDFHPSLGVLEILDWNVGFPHFSQPTVWKECANYDLEWASVLTLKRSCCCYFFYFISFVLKEIKLSAVLNIWPHRDLPATANQWTVRPQVAL